MRSTYPGASTLSIAPSLAADLWLNYVRVDDARDEPAPEPGVLDVAVLDMHHGYPNLGHASIVETLLSIAHDERRRLGKPSGFRVISYDVRAGLAVPASSPARFPLIVGTGGPGALDPRDNDGKAEASQGVKEDPSWEAPLWRFFDRVLSEERTSFFAVCHSFGVLARWSGLAEAVLRPPSKGGKSHGPVTNLLTPAAEAHPYFCDYYRESGPEVQVLDSRLYDLVPVRSLPGATLAYESNGGGLPGEAVTMLELARDRGGVLPRVWGVNHHPEIGDKGLQRERLKRLAARGGVSAEWLKERREALDAWNHSAATEHRLQTTSSYTFEMPLRRLISRALEEGRGA
jgi:hypothetical protein